MSTDTPRHWVSSLDQRVTQWMSAVMVSAGSARNSCQVQDLLIWPPWVMENVHASSGVCGVGPADNTGNPSVRYWPGGTRPASPAGARCRWRKPCETGLITGQVLSARRLGHGTGSPSPLGRPPTPSEVIGSRARPARRGRSAMVGPAGYRVDT